MPSAPRNEHGIADFVMHGGYATIAANPAAIIIFFIFIFLSLEIGIGDGNILDRLSAERGGGSTS